MIRRPPRSTQSRSSAASDVYKRQDPDRHAGALWHRRRDRELDPLLPAGRRDCHALPRNPDEEAEYTPCLRRKGSGGCMNPTFGSILIKVLAGAIQSGTILLLPTLGEVLTERSGVLNLGLEGLMLIGAFFGFLGAMKTGNPYVGLLLGMAAAAVAATIHAFICVTLRGNQTVTGLALTIFGTGLTSFYGDNWVSQRLTTVIQPMAIPGLSRIPFVGPVLFSQDLIVYAGYILVALFWFLLFKTKVGANLRAVGENAKTADAMGVNVVGPRYFWTIVGGALAGAGGAYITCCIHPYWLNGILSLIHISEPTRLGM